VRVDGAPARGGNLNEGLAVGYTKHGNPYLTVVPTDIGFTIAPGTHRVTIGAPGCAPLDAQLSVDRIMPAFVSGRLPVSDDSLQGPAGAPNGVDVMLAAYSSSRGAHTSTDLSGATTYAWNDIDTTGGMMSLGYEHRDLAVAYDIMVGTASATGTSMNMANPFNANLLQIGNQLRVGFRVPEHTVALAAGAGLGGDANVVTSGLLGVGGDFDFYVPLWASLTIKPSCDWGVQVLASYNMHPTSMNESAPELVAGLQWQPSASCSEQAGLTVR
jgi:hypothetical protein